MPLTQSLYFASILLVGILIVELSLISSQFTASPQLALKLNPFAVGFYGLDDGDPIGGLQAIDLVTNAAPGDIEMIDFLYSGDQANFYPITAVEQGSVGVKGIHQAIINVNTLPAGNLLLKARVLDKYGRSTESIKAVFVGGLSLAPEGGQEGVGRKISFSGEESNPISLISFQGVPSTQPPPTAGQGGEPPETCGCRQAKAYVSGLATLDPGIIGWVYYNGLNVQLPVSNTVPTPPALLLLGPNPPAGQQASMVINEYTANSVTQEKNKIVSFVGYEPQTVIQYPAGGAVLLDAARTSRELTYRVHYNFEVRATYEGPDSPNCKEHQYIAATIVARDGQGNALKTLHNTGNLDNPFTPEGRFSFAGADLSNPLIGQTFGEDDYHLKGTTYSPAGRPYVIKTRNYPDVRWGDGPGGVPDRIGEQTEFRAKFYATIGPESGSGHVCQCKFSVEFRADGAGTMATIAPGAPFVKNAAGHSVIDPDGSLRGACS